MSTFITFSLVTHESPILDNHFLLQFQWTTESLCIRCSSAFIVLSLLSNPLSVCVQQERLPWQINVILQASLNTKLNLTLSKAGFFQFSSTMPIAFFKVFLKSSNSEVSYMTHGLRLNFTLPVPVLETDIWHFKSILEPYPRKPFLIRSN